MATIVSRWKSHPARGAFLVAAVTLATLLPCVDPLGSYPALPEGPGLTIDESFNVQQGVYLLEAARLKGIFLFDPPNLQEVFGKGSLHLPDHPPLGRLWLGLHHHLVRSLVPPRNPDGLITIACARTGSMTAFALTILLVGGFAAKWYGERVGTFAAISLALMPRMFGHAHLAALESTIDLTWTAAALVFADRWFEKEAPAWKTATWTGAIWGLALLTKIQAILLLPAVGLLAVVRWKHRAPVPLIIWGIAGFAVFFVGWPWLWLDPLANLREFFGRTTDRATLHVFYFGQQYADRDAPASYPFVIFALVVPTLLQIAGCGSLVSFIKRRPTSNSTSETNTPLRDGFLLACVLVPLIVFAIPNVAVYNGERLFSIVFPIWAIFIGRGLLLLQQFLSRRFPPRIGTIAVAVCFLFAGVEGQVLRPCYLGFYNGFIGYLPGASAMGMELDYWATSVTRSTLEDGLKNVPKGGTVLVSPVFHQFQLDDLRSQSPLIREREWRLIPADAVPPESLNQANAILRFHPLPEPEAREAGFEISATTTRLGVGLTTIQRKP